jgi:hypothetical protein
METMKRMSLTLLSLALAAVVNGQSPGLLNFTNDVTSLVTNGLTGGPVTATNGIRVGLYVAPEGITDESAFLILTNTVLVGLSGPGRYGGGYRSVPSFMPSNAAMIQVRAFETNYGSSYEAALVAPPMNGRRALVGKSGMGRVILGSSIPSAQTPKVGPIVGPVILFPVDGPPVISANDIAVSEGSNGTVTATFAVRLLAPATNNITVDFATTDGTALAGSDYEPTNGTLVFLPGETTKAVPVTLLPDAPPEPEETFSLALSNPTGALLLRSTILCTIVEVRITALSIDTSVSFSTLAGRRYLLERSGDGINWFPVPGVATNVLATGSSLTIVDRGSGCQPMALYRASLLQ